MTCAGWGNPIWSPDAELRTLMLERWKSTALVRA
jgi:hypothetical protein